MNDINNKCLGGKLKGEIVDRSIELFTRKYTEMHKIGEFN